MNAIFDPVICQEKITSSPCALWRARRWSIKISSAHFGLSADGSCSQAEPDIHLQSETPKSPHRRLSLCSLPVPKQLEESLGVASVARVVTCGTWQSAHRMILMFFPLLGRVFRLPRLV